MESVWFFRVIHLLIFCEMTRGEPEGYYGSEGWYSPRFKPSCWMSWAKRLGICCSVSEKKGLPLKQAIGIHCNSLLGFWAYQRSPHIAGFTDSDHSWTNGQKNLWNHTATMDTICWKRTIWRCINVWSWSKPAHGNHLAWWATVFFSSFIWGLYGNRLPIIPWSAHFYQSLSSFSGPHHSPKFGLASSELLIEGSTKMAPETAQTIHCHTCCTIHWLSTWAVFKIPLSFHWILVL